MVNYLFSTKIKEHPIAALEYASKNHYDDIANQAALLSLDVEGQLVSKLLSPEHLLRWVRISPPLVVLDVFELMKLVYLP